MANELARQEADSEACLDKIIAAIEARVMEREKEQVAAAKTAEEPTRRSGALKNRIWWAHTEGRPRERSSVMGERWAEDERALLCEVRTAGEKKKKKWSCGFGVFAKKVGSKVEMTLEDWKGKFSFSLPLCIESPFSC